MKGIKTFILSSVLMCTVTGAMAWPGMEMPELHVEGRWLVDEDGNHVNLHGFGQTYSPWFNEQGKKWSNYDVNACLEYNKQKIDEVLDAGWKMNYLRLHMDPYWSNTPGVATTGENDISAFDFNRFRTYLSQVFIPMAEYAVSKGLYVVMRPPGVCPEEIAIGDDYHKYLKRVWGYVSTQTKLKNHPNIMFELANEPVRIKDTDGVYRSNTDGCNKNLTAFFQEIVDLMRGNGCNNILWVPGTGYQSQYAGFAKYPIEGENIGYAVHVYPGWYGSDAIEPSHELGGSYGGGFNSFAAGWAAQIEPAAAIAPIMVTEMDWAPSKYNASWGKSITGRMMGEGFGANFKLLADMTGNVSWMIFTGAELLGQFDGKAGSEGNYTLQNDPDACLWPAWHWFSEYAGEQLTSGGSVELRLSAPVDGDKCVIMPGNSVGAAVVESIDGVEYNRQCDVDVEIDNEDVLVWNNGRFYALGHGSATAKVSFSHNGKVDVRTIHFTSTPFPLQSGYFNPSIWETGSFNQSTGIVQTGTYGFAGWQYGNGLDVSDSRYIIAELATPSSAGVSFRLYDQNNYWSDPVMADFGNSTRVAIDLDNMYSSNGRRLDSSHLYIVGFWSTGSSPFRLSRVYLSDSPDGDSAIDAVFPDSAASKVDVYDLSGVKIRSGVDISVATDQLAPGFYIVGKNKVLIR